MKLKALLQTWDETRSENRFLRLTNTALILCVLAMGFALMIKDRTVVLVPPKLDATSWVSSESASPEMFTAQALFLTSLIGNVNGDTASFLRDQLPGYLSSAVYKQVMDSLDRQIETVQEERLTLFFSANDVYYNPAGHRVYVVGESLARSVRGAEQRQIKTYELGFRVVDHRLLVDRLIVHQDRVTGGA